MKFIYLASPYSHPDHEVREARYRAACRKAAQYARKGIAVFAPIVHSHPLVPYMDAAQCMDFDLWMKLDLPLLKAADELHILCIDGWRASRGVTREVEFATQIGVPVKQVFLDVEP
jgi:hypothetical protein